MTLHVKEIDFSAGTLTVRSGKGNMGRMTFPPCPRICAGRLMSYEAGDFPACMMRSINPPSAVYARRS